MHLLRLPVRMITSVLYRKEDNRAAGVCQGAAGARALPACSRSHGLQARRQEFELCVRQILALTGRICNVCWTSGCFDDSRWQQKRRNAV
jgi:hypothetical protein